MKIKREDGSILILSEDEIKKIVFAFNGIQVTEQPKQSYKRWIAAVDEKYWHYNSYSDEITELVEEGELSDLNFHNAGNYFKTKEEAEHHRDKILFTQKYKDAIREKNEGWVPDWSDTAEHKYYLFYNQDINKVISTSSAISQAVESDFVFKCGTGGQLLKEFTQEDLIKYLYS